MDELCAEYQSVIIAGVSPLDQVITASTLRSTGFSAPAAPPAKWKQPRIWMGTRFGHWTPRPANPKSRLNPFTAK